MLSLSRARELARAVKHAPHARTVVNTVRPRFGLCRERLPLQLLIYVAAREGRLVQCGRNGFALLESPRRGRPRSRHPWLTLLDRQWTLAFLAVPAFTGLLAALVLGLAGAVLIALLLILFALGWVLVVQLATFVVGFVTGVRVRQRPRDSFAAESLPYEQWTVVLCHQPDPDATGDMLRGVERRRGELAATGTPLVWLLDAVTTDAMRHAVSAAPGQVHPYGAGAKHVAVLAPPLGVGRPARRPIDMVGFFVLYVAVVIGMVFGLAWMVADAEAEAAPDSDACTGRPVTYALALRWLLSRTLLHDPPGIAPATTGPIVMGWGVSLAALMAVVLFVLAIVQRRGVHATVERDFDAAIARMQEQKRVLVVVSDIPARNAVLEAARRVLGHEPSLVPVGDHVIFQFEAVAETRLMVVQSDRGTLGPGGTTLTVAAVIDATRPHSVIGAGLAYGLGPLADKAGDIVVSTRVRVLGHGFRPGAEGRDDIVGDYVPPTTRLLDRFRAATYGWSGPEVHFGPLLSVNLPLDTAQRRADALEANPDALAAETDGAGIYAAAQKAKADWIVVRTVGAAGSDAGELIMRMLRGGDFR